MLSRAIDLPKVAAAPAVDGPKTAQSNSTPRLFTDEFWRRQEEEDARQAEEKKAEDERLAAALAKMENERLLEQQAAANLIGLTLPPSRFVSNDQLTEILDAECATPLPDLDDAALMVKVTRLNALLILVGREPVSTRAEGDANTAKWNAVRERVDEVEVEVRRRRRKAEELRRYDPKREARRAEVIAEFEAAIAVLNEEHPADETAAIIHEQKYRELVDGLQQARSAG